LRPLSPPCAAESPWASLTYSLLQNRIPVGTVGEGQQSPRDLESFDPNGAVPYSSLARRINPMAQPLPTSVPARRVPLTRNQRRGFGAALGGWAIDGMGSFVRSPALVYGVPDLAGFWRSQLRDVHCVAARTVPHRVPRWRLRFLHFFRAPLSAPLLLF